MPTTTEGKPAPRVFVRRNMIREPPSIAITLIGDPEEDTHPKKSRPKWIAYDDPRSPNCTIFYFDHEDHTLGGLLTSMLQLRRDVVFAGYRVAHPHDVRFELRLETDGTRSPHEVLHSTAVDCAADVSQLAKVWTHEWLLWQATAEGKMDMEERAQLAATQEAHRNRYRALHPRPVSPAPSNSPVLASPPAFVPRSPEYVPGMFSNMFEPKAGVDASPAFSPASPQLGFAGFGGLPRSPVFGAGSPAASPQRNVHPERRSNFEARFRPVHRDRRERSRSPGYNRGVPRQERAHRGYNDRDDHRRNEASRASPSYSPYQAQAYAGVRGGGRFSPDVNAGEDADKMDEDEREEEAREAAQMMASPFPVHRAVPGANQESPMSPTSPGWGSPRFG